ncbi:MAG: phage portal protein [Spirochaetaceae bacterium 4572_59]|nr:MAG: phage portal protein [Spirochaetaceae bacterium 4572_59]
MDITIDLNKIRQFPMNMVNRIGSMIPQKRNISEGNFPYLNMVSKDGRPLMNETSALNLSAVWNAVDLLSSHIAMLPLILYKRTGSGGKIRAVDHPLYSVLSIEPNELMTSFQMRQASAIHQELWGDTYIWVCRPGNGSIELWPLNPGVTHRDKLNGKIIYRTTVDGQAYEIPKDQMIHIPVMTLNGIDGINPIAKRRRSFTLMQSAEEQAESFYQNSSKPAGIIQLKKALSDEAFNRLRGSWEAFNGGGVHNHHRTAILEEEGEFKPIQFNAEEIQMLGSREFSVTEVARWFNIPPHKIKDLSRSTFSNIEHQNIDYVQDSLLPRLIRIEQAMTKTLLTREEQKEYFIEFLVDGLLRGDSKTRYEVYQLARQNGAMSANEWRQKENMNPIDDPSGDAYFVPLNMIDMKQALLPEEANQENSARGVLPSQQRGLDKRRTITNRFTKKYKTLARNILEEEIPAVRNIISASGENLQELNEALERFYERFAGSVSRMAAGIVQINADEIRSIAQDEVGVAMADSEYEAFINRFVESFGLRYSIRSKQEIKKRETVEEMNAQTDRWKEVRPEQVSQARILVESAVARTVWRSVGVTKIQSVSKGGCCAYCDALDGKVIGIEENFLEPGQFQPDGADAPLKVSSIKSHPPYHDGCVCGIQPVVE